MLRNVSLCLQINHPEPIEKNLPFIGLLLTLSLFPPNIIAQNSAEWHLRSNNGKGWIHDIEFSPHGDQLAVATTIGVWIYDAYRRRTSPILRNHGECQCSFLFSRWSCTHWDQTQTITNTGNRRPLSTLTGPSEIHAITFSPDGHACQKTTSRVWDVQTEELTAILPYNDTINTRFFSQMKQVEVRMAPFGLGCWYRTQV